MTTFLPENFELKVIGFATLVYSVGYMAIASVGYLMEEMAHRVRGPSGVR